MVNPRCFLDFSHGGQPIGRVVFELFMETVPKTSENFRALCTGSAGLSKTTGVPLHYKGSIMHRVIDGFMIQGGDFTKKNGTGGESIYGGPFEDEDLTSTIDQEGLLVMANRGPNTNGSQFFITLAPCPHLTGKHVLFGKVVGPSSMDVVRQIAGVQVDGKDKPLSPVEIVHCGELELRKKPPAQPQVRKRSVSPASDASSSRSSRARSQSVSSRSSEDSDDERDRKRRKKAAKKEKKEAKRAAKKAKKEEKRRKRAERSPSPATKLRLEEDRLEAERQAEDDRKREELREQERREAKLRELERLKREEEQARRRRGTSEDNDDEIVYKGRGAMKYRENGSSRGSGMRTAW